MADDPKDKGGTGTPPRGDDEPEGRRSRRGPTDEGRGVARRLLERFRGRAEDVIAEMADEARALRDERRDLKQKLGEFQGDGVVVLKGEDAKAYTEFKALGKKPSDIKTELDQLGGLKAKVADSERAELAKSAAPHLGWNADTFAAMVKDKGLEVSLVDAKDKDGKDIKVPHVRPVGAAAEVKATSASDWVNANASYMVPALTTKPSTQQTTQTQTTQRTGTQFVEQGSTQNGNTNTNGATGTKPAAVPGVRNYVLPSQRNATAEKK